MKVICAQFYFYCYYYYHLELTIFAAIGTGEGNNFKWIICALASVRWMDGWAATAVHPGQLKRLSTVNNGRNDSSGSK